MGTLKILRKARNLSQEKVAENLYVHVNTLQNWERSDKPPIEQLQRLLELYRINQDERLEIMEQLYMNRIQTTDDENDETYTAKDFLCRTDRIWEIGYTGVINALWGVLFWYDREHRNRTNTITTPKDDPYMWFVLNSPQLPGSFSQYIHSNKTFNYDVLTKEEFLLYSETLGLTIEERELLQNRIAYENTIDNIPSFLEEIDHELYWRLQVLNLSAEEVDAFGYLCEVSERQATSENIYVESQTYDADTDAYSTGNEIYGVKMHYQDRPHPDYTFYEAHGGYSRGEILIDNLQQKVGELNRDNPWHQYITRYGKECPDKPFIARQLSKSVLSEMIENVYSDWLYKSGPSYAGTSTYDMCAYLKNPHYLGTQYEMNDIDIKQIKSPWCYKDGELFSECFKEDELEAIEGIVSIVPIWKDKTLSKKDTEKMIESIPRHCEDNGLKDKIERYEYRLANHVNQNEFAFKSTRESVPFQYFEIVNKEEKREGEESIHHYYLQLTEYGRKYLEWEETI